MPKGKWIDKKTATHFTLVYRPQNDPLIHDESAPSMVLNPTQLPNNAGSSVRSHRSKKLDDLASELGSDALSIRDNEGEAANYGIYYDDTEYDYMQHMRDLGDGTGAGNAVFLEATPLNQGKAKGKQPSLEDALRQLDLRNQAEDLKIDEDMLPNKNLQRLTYQSQQDVPDAIAGFQPDMDPRLREVLEALEDDAYVDEDEDIFKELAKDGDELDQYEFEEQYDEFEGEGYDDDDAGWESDHTAKPAKEYKEDEVPQLVDTAQTEGGASGDWMADFKKFKDDQNTDKKKKTRTAAAPAASEIQSSIWTTTTNGGRRKKRNGAMTNPSTYSMTSSVLQRTEQLGILDARFEKIEEEYNADMDDDMASMSQVSTASSVQGPLRQDFDGMLDEFLGEYSMNGKKRVKKGKWNSGTAQLDEIRRELGPARIRPGMR
ncbi:Low temperature viability protein [Diplogelasinospora grovesii]|uniref:Low temperature viability protein n=1 Tax=Diplogelasinospora grovesii TaxID=303347 RepID=A0AAN6NFG1_9PEZI|nr:Low temperature viability protein [Diplogelasinospora grovesii]